MDDLLNPMITQLQCLAGTIGVEGANPTCQAWGYPSNYLGDLFSWSPILLFVGVFMGVPIGLFIVRKMLDMVARAMGE